MSNRLRAAIVIALVPVVLLLAGCEEGRKCLEWDTDVVPSTKLVNGRVVPDTKVVTHCERYEEEKVDG